MKKILFPVIISVLLSVLTLAVVEGVYSVVEWQKRHRSIVYQLSALAGLAGDPRDSIAAYKPYFSDPRELGELIPLIEQQGIGIGNTSFDVRSELSAIATLDNGCPTLKPDIHKTAFFLHSSAFNPFDPITVFYDAGKELDPRLAEFFQRYGGPHTNLSSNAQGERVTIPDIAADRVVLVAGDSVAFGAMIDDSETIASQMQARDRTRRYVNLGVFGTDAEEIHCRLESAVSRYKGRIDELIYVYCENDLQPGRPYGTPKEVIDSLKSIVTRENIGKVTVVFAPSIYMILPELTRIDGTRGSGYPRREKERTELKALVEAAGFRWADTGDLARQEEETQKTPFAVLSHFVDIGHLSAYGTKNLVDHLMSAD